MNFSQQYGPMAVIAGGSEGVGAAYARILAERGLDLALVARKAEPLEALAAEIRAAYPEREVLTLAMDLTADDASDRIAALTGAREVGLLIYNAGASDRTGDFLGSDLDAARRLLTLNTMTKMVLCHAYGRPMKARGRGGIILVGSLASLIGNPGLAVYSASKAFSSAFAEALWFELKPHGVNVLGHILSMTNTPSNARHFPHMAGQGDDPALSAQQGLDALGNGPIFRATGGDQLFQLLAGLNRGEAVARAYEMGAPLRAGCLSPPGRASPCP
jgi:short-subunit dehydrogenase